MSTKPVRTNDPASDAGVARVATKLEVVIIPVADVDRSKEFYKKLGWRLDADFRFDNGFRIVQFTPPGSGCSIQFGTKITSAAPGSAQGLYLIVSDIGAAHDEIAARGVAISDVFHSVTPGAQFQPIGPSGRVTRTCSQSRHLQFLRHLQRPGWQHLAPAGSHYPASRTRRPRLDYVRLSWRRSKRASPCLGLTRRT